METNEYKIRISGVANIPRPLINGCGYDLELNDVEVRKIERIPNDDGTENEVASLKISELTEIIIKSGDKQIKGKKKGSQAKVLRFYIEKEAERQGIDTEKYYQEEMSKLIDKYKNI